MKSLARFESWRNGSLWNRGIQELFEPMRAKKLGPQGSAPIHVTSPRSTKGLELRMAFLRLKKCLPQLIYSNHEQRWGFQGNP